MRNKEDHIISKNASLKDALVKLNDLGKDAVVFIVDKESRLIGSLTDGDVRRGLLTNKNLNSNVSTFLQQNPKFLRKDNYKIEELILLRNMNYRIIPVLNDNNQIIDVINFDYQKSYLPIDVLLMAGGQGTRLRPLTEKIPKPLLKVGDKSIIDINLDRLISYGINNFYISILYLGDQIENHLINRKLRKIKIDFLREKKPLGTIGAASMIKDFSNDYVLVTNSDILTLLDYEDFFSEFLKSGADMSVVGIPYEIKIPYAVMKIENNFVKEFVEKPNYIYYSNGGIYLVKKEILLNIPKNQFYNATDLMNSIIENGGKLHTYPLKEYWLDIGKHDDYLKANGDIKHLKL